MRNNQLTTKTKTKHIRAINENVITFQFGFFFIS